MRCHLSRTRTLSQELALVQVWLSIFVFIMINLPYWFKFWTKNLTNLHFLGKYLTCYLSSTSILKNVNTFLQDLSHLWASTIDIPVHVLHVSIHLPMWNYICRKRCSNLSKFFVWNKKIVWHIDNSRHWWRWRKRQVSNVADAMRQLCGYISPLGAWFGSRDDDDFKGIFLKIRHDCVKSQ